MNKQARLHFFATLAAHNPHPVTELHYQSHFELLIAVMLSAQATDKSVNRVTDVLFPIAHTPATILALGEAGLSTYIRSINFYPTKAKHIIKTCAILIEKYQGEVPDTRSALEQLPGVGRKTANVILNTAFGVPVMPVDTHIFRVARRTGLAHGKTPRAIEEALLKNIDPQYLQNAHHWLVLHGRYICTARKPHCAVCPVRSYCDYYRSLSGEPSVITV